MSDIMSDKTGLYSHASSHSVRTFTFVSQHCMQSCILNDFSGAPAGIGDGGGIADDRTHFTLAAVPYHTAPLTACHLGCPPAKCMQAGRVL